MIQAKGEKSFVASGVPLTPRPVSPAFELGARLVTAGALLLWVLALALLGLIQQNVSYTVCSGSLLSLPPPSIHWPPEGQNLGLIDLEHRVTLLAVAASIVGGFLLLYANRTRGTLLRVGLLLAATVGSLLLAAVLWLIVHYMALSDQVGALAHCL